MTHLGTYISRQSLEVRCNNAENTSVRPRLKGSLAMPEPSCDIGLIGLAVMGRNLVLNMADHGYRVAVFNRTTSKVDEFVKGQPAETRIVGTHTVAQLCAELKRPRRIMLMVKAGEVVDQTIAQILPNLERGDILIDGGNSLFTDTNRRSQDLAQRGILFVGSGVSGGEEGARHGPSIMPGGNPEAWPHVKEILQSIAAKALDRSPCCEWIGRDGAGHYVKMVHNGIEYGDMQIIGEAYQLLRDGLGLAPDDLARVFGDWNKGELGSFLIEITAAIFAKRDTDGNPLIDKILDAAGQKGTGKWTAISALDLGMPLTLIGESVFARCLSALKDERTRASKILRGPQPPALPAAMKDEFIENVRRALYCAKIISYAQGAQVEFEPRRHCHAVERRLHHPLGLPRRHQAGLHPQARTREPASRRILRRRPQ
jgi:6-phosphogluconate dehydrogenase